MTSLSELEKGLLGFRSGCFLRGGWALYRASDVSWGYHVMSCDITLYTILCYTKQYCTKYKICSIVSYNKLQNMAM